ncbi:MAG TPA: PilZ domain-containing protein, partial [Candidatus Acidoferrales bacterium]|nr:PilZ domain-containing protein [Candidatus Acidoferrales bacterium]
MLQEAAQPFAHGGAFAPIRPEPAWERRRFVRYSLASKLRGRDLLFRPSREGQRVAQGQIRNISGGGLCLLINNRPAKESYVLRCELPLPGIPASIPTLMQVRWSRQTPGKHRYLIGLQFL